MIVGIGIDVIANSRVERELSRGDWLLDDGIFTDREIGKCNGAGSPALHYAACFAAKEATLKALGVDVDDLAMMREVEVEFGDRGRCAVVLQGRLQSESEHLGVRHIRLSIASGKQQTGAMVILES